MSDWRVHGYDPRRLGTDVWLGDGSMPTRNPAKATTMSHETATTSAALLNVSRWQGLRWTIELHTDRSTTP